MPQMTPDVFNAFVHLTDEQGKTHAFGPGDPIPDWARPLIGDHVIHRGGLFEEDESPEAVAVMAAKFDDEPPPAEPEPADTSEEVFPVDFPEPPPTSGPGSGQGAWLAYARALGETEPTDSWSRTDIIGLLERRGHPIS